LLAEGKSEAAAAVKIDTVDFAGELKVLTGTLPAYKQTSAEFAKKLEAALGMAPAMPTPELACAAGALQSTHPRLPRDVPRDDRSLETWDYTRPVPWYQSFTAFLFGREWLTASFWQDWYGIVPLFAGSLMVSFVALHTPFRSALALRFTSIKSQHRGNSV